MDLSYDALKVTPGPQKISIDRTGNIYEEIDSSYRMKERRKITGGSVANIFVGRDFRGRAADYGIVTLNFEVISPAWEDIKVLTVKGRLAPGGRLDDISHDLV